MPYPSSKSSGRGRPRSPPTGHSPAVKIVHSASSERVSLAAREKQRRHGRDGLKPESFSEMAWKPGLRNCLTQAAALISHKPPGPHNTPLPPSMPLPLLSPLFASPGEHHGPQGGAWVALPATQGCCVGIAAAVGACFGLPRSPFRRDMCVLFVCVQAPAGADTAFFPLRCSFLRLSWLAQPLSRAPQA